MKKRFLALFTCAMLLISMVAGTAFAQTATGETVKITFWHSMSDEAGELMQQLITDFNQGIGMEKGIEVEGVFQGSYSDSTSKLRAILQNDQPDQLPDVMQIDATGMVDYQATDYKYTATSAMENDESFDVSSLMEVPVMNWNYNGVQLGLPFSSSTTVMYYNKTMLDEAGVTQAPTTFQEISDLAAKLPATNDDGQTIYAYAGVPNSPSLANWIGQIKGENYNASYLTDNLNGRTATATKLVCDSEGTLNLFLTEWKNMYDSGAVLNQSSGTSELFMTGQLALFVTSSSNLTTLLTTIDNKFELGCAYLPRVNEQSNFGATVSGSGIFMFDSGDDARKTAAWEFEKYLVSAQAQADFCTGTGYFPACNDSYDTDTYKDFVALYPQMEVAVNQTNETSTDMLGITVGPSWDFYMDMMEIIAAGLDNGTSVSDIETELADDLNGLLTAYLESNQ